MRAMQREILTSAPVTAPPPPDLSRNALFLDLDGTLLDLQERPHAVRASEEVRDLLRRVAKAASGAMAIVTGRTIADATSILHGGPHYIAGVHGFEIQRGGSLVRDDADLSRLDQARIDVRELLQRHAIPALVEDKQASLALHYRHVPESAGAVKQIAREIAAQRGLRMLEGKMVVELIASTRTKGHALTVFMAAPPFAGRIPIAIGDDHTDEDAFAAARRLGGSGVLVGEPRESAAAYNLAGPAAVTAWLRSGLLP
jgi:trehalose 6-phosphate phosphatase